MAKIERKKAEIFAENAQAAAYGVSQFGSLKAGTPNFTKDLDTIQALPAYKEGWHSATVADQSPALEDRNALDYVNSRQIAYLLQQGIPEWLGTETYYTNAYVVGSDGKLYHAKAQSTNQNPVNDTANTYWEPFTSGSSLPLFFSTWSDHLFEDTYWLCADTFSWQSGSIYTSAYQHLVDDISGMVAERETISGTTITFYRATDGHKICLANQESNVAAIYNTTGIAWYYILDITNIRFKLPRSKWAFTGLRDTVGSYVAESLPNITGLLGCISDGSESASATGAFYMNSTYGYGEGSGQSGKSYGNQSFSFDASRSSSAYQNNAPVQQRATQMYLYFYVGNTVQDQTTIDVGEITEALNGKADTDLANVPASKGILTESYVNGTSWYRVYSDGWCEQGGQISITYDANSTITFLKPFSNTNYNIVTSNYFTGTEIAGVNNGPVNWVQNKTTTTAKLYEDIKSCTVMWLACGYIS